MIQEALNVIRSPRSDVLTANKCRDRKTLFDCCFVSAVIFLSALPYQLGLGFYLDDWNTLSIFTAFASRGPVVMLRQLLAMDTDMIVRPVQPMLLLLEYEVFGRNPVPYHLVITAMIGLLAVILYLTILEFGLARWLAFAVSVTFGLLPHYSTGRVWISSQQAVCCMMFALLGIYSMLRWARPTARRSVWWLAIAAASLIVSILAYEVGIGLIAVSMAWIAYRRFRESGTWGSRVGGMGILLALLLLVGIVKTGMQERIAYHHNFLQVLGHTGAMMWHAITQAILFNAWTYTLQMPMVLVRMYRLGALTAFSLAISVTITILVVAFLWPKELPVAAMGRRQYVWLAVVGFLLFFVGIGLLVNRLDYNYSTAGSLNRVVIASALGTACILVAAAGLLCSVFTQDIVRARVLAIAIGVICGTNCLAVSGIAWFWQRGAMEQATIIQSIAAETPALPHNGVLLLDGFCHYAGPAVVFEDDWDLTGALRLTKGDYTLNGDVPSVDLRFENEAVISPLPWYAGRNYPYSDRLFIYNVQHNVFRPLPSKTSADAYLREFNPTGLGDCPFGQEDYGTKVF
jgi:hypothetical protein